MSAASTREKPAYLLVQGVVTDREGSCAYTSALPPIYRRYGGQYLALVPASLLEVPEREPEERGVVIARFPSRRSAREFWDSPEYAATKKLRDGKGLVYVTIPKGCDMRRDEVRPVGMSAATRPVRYTRAIALTAGLT